MPEQTENPKATKRTVSAPAPIIMDLGKQDQSDIDDLVEGEGGLFKDVHKAIDRLRESGDIKSESQIVIVTVQEKREKKVLEKCSLGLL